MFPFVITSSVLLLVQVEGLINSSGADGVNWYHWKGHNYSAKRAEMNLNQTSELLRTLRLWFPRLLAGQRKSVIEKEKEVTG